MQKKRIKKAYFLSVILVSGNFFLSQFLISSEFFHDTNRHRGRNVVLETRFAYIDTFNHFLAKYPHELTVDVNEFARIAHEHHFTERDIEQIIEEAYGLSMSCEKSIDNKVLHLIINGHKNDKIFDQWIEQQKPEREIIEKLKQMKEKFHVARRLLYIWDVLRDPDADNIEKVRDLLIELQGEFSQLGGRALDYFKVTTTPQEDEKQWRTAPCKRCHLAPYLAGSQPPEICQILRHLIHPERYKAHVNNTLILYGPPGTGKTAIAESMRKTLAKNNIPVEMIQRPASALMTEYQASGSRAVQEIFDSAGAVTDAGKIAIVFIDEIDAVAQRRDSVHNEDVRNTLNQLLIKISEHKKEPKLVVILATNFESELDAALMNRVTKVHVPRPDKEKMREIFKFYLTCYDKFYNSEGAQRSLGKFAHQAYKAKFTGRDVEKIVNYAKESCEEKNINRIIEEAVFEEIKKSKENN